MANAQAPHAVEGPTALSVDEAVNLLYTALGWDKVRDIWHRMSQVSTTILPLLTTSAGPTARTLFCLLLKD